MIWCCTVLQHCTDEEIEVILAGWKATGAKRAVVIEEISQGRRVDDPARRLFRRPMADYQRLVPGLSPRATVVLKE